MPTTRSPLLPQQPATAAGPPPATTHGVRRSALVAGAALGAMTFLAIFANFGAVSGLVTEGDATRTAADVLGSQGLFRAGIAALVLVVVLDIVVAWALKTFFAPAHQGVAVLAAWFRLAYAAVFAVAIGQLTAVLPLLGDDAYLRTISLDQRRTEALLKIGAFHDIWTVALVLFGLHLVLIGYLAYVSGYVPRVLAVLLVVGGLGYLADSFGALLISGYTFEVSVVTFVGEALFWVWLLVKGRSVDLAPSHS